MSNWKQEWNIDQVCLSRGLVVVCTRLDVFVLGQIIIVVLPTVKGSSNMRSVRCLIFS